MPLKGRHKLKNRKWDWEPGFQTYYDIGVEVSKQLPAHCTFVEIGKYLGVSKQNAYTATIVALGKLCYGLRQIRAAEGKVI